MSYHGQLAELAYRARLESVLSARVQGFESSTVRHAPVAQRQRQQS